MRTTKDSGFEWIGIIPTEWGLSKIGQVYRLRNTKVNDTDYPPLSALMMIANSLRKATLLSTVVLTDEARAEFQITMVPYHLSILSWHH